MHKKGKRNKVYSPEFKATVIEAMRRENLGLFETIERFSLQAIRTTQKTWLDAGNEYT